jgi:hypothetical protein
MYSELYLPAGTVVILLIAFAFLLYYTAKKFRKPPAKGPVIPPPKAKPDALKPKVWLGSGEGFHTGDTSFRIEKREPKVVKHKPMGRPKIWLEECTDRSVTARCDHQDAWKHYLRWCHEEERQHVPRQKFLNIISRELPPVPGERAFAGLVLLEAVA